MNYSSGVILSRTFQILNKKLKNSVILFNKQIIRLTKSLISKCRGKGKPIFSYIDIDEEVLYYRKQEISELKDVMYNVDIHLFR